MGRPPRRVCAAGRGVRVQSWGSHGADALPGRSGRAVGALCPVQEGRGRLCQVALRAENQRQHPLCPRHHGERQRPGPLCQHLPAGTDGAAAGHGPTGLADVPRDGQWPVGWALTHEARYCPTAMGTDPRSSVLLQGLGVALQGWVLPRWLGIDLRGGWHPTETGTDPRGWESTQGTGDSSWGWSLAPRTRGGHLLWGQVSPVGLGIALWGQTPPHGAGHHPKGLGIAHGAKNCCS